MKPSEFLEDIFSACDDHEWLSIFTLDRANGSNRVWWYRLDELDKLDLHVSGDGNVVGILSRQCVWFSAATRRERLEQGRGAAVDCLHVPALWLDIDVAGPGHKTTKPLPPTKDDALALIDDYHVKPSYVIDSGHGLQAWWKLDAPIPAWEAGLTLTLWGQGWQQMAAERGWHIDNVFDVARIMRLPGTFNTKEV